MSASPLIQYSVNGSQNVALANGQSAFLQAGTLLSLAPQSTAGLVSIVYTFSCPGTSLDGVILSSGAAPWSGEVWLPNQAITATVTTQVNGLASSSNTLFLLLQAGANGGFTVPSYGTINLTLSGRGTFSNVATNGSSLQVIGGPTGAFALGSVRPSAALLSGQPVTFQYAGGQPFSLVHQDSAATGSSLKFAINGQTTANAQVIVFGKITVHYDGTNLIADFGSQYKHDWSIQDFGGSTTNADNAAAFAACTAFMTSLGGGVVRFPTGTLNSSASFVVPANTTVRGTGRLSSIVHRLTSASEPATDFTDVFRTVAALNSNTQQHVIFEDIGGSKAIPPAWAPGTVYTTPGTLVRPTCAFGQSTIRYLRLVTAGTSGSVEPIGQLTTLTTTPTVTVGGALTSAPCVGTVTGVSKQPYSGFGACRVSFTGVNVLNGEYVTITGATGTGANGTYQVATVGSTSLVDLIGSSWLANGSSGTITRMVMLRVEIVSGGALSGGITYAYSVDNGNNWTVGTTNNTTPITVHDRAVGVDTGLTISFASATYTAGMTWTSPPAKWSLYLGSQITDGTCVWEVVDAGAIFCDVGGSYLTYNRVAGATGERTFIFDQTEVFAVRDTYLNTNDAGWVTNDGAHNPAALYSIFEGTNKGDFSGAHEWNTGGPFIFDGGESFTFSGITCAGQFAICAAQGFEAADLYFECGNNGTCPFLFSNGTYFWRSRTPSGALLNVEISAKLLSAKIAPLLSFSPQLSPPSSSGSGLGGEAAASYVDVHDVFSAATWPTATVGATGGVNHISQRNNAGNWLTFFDGSPYVNAGAQLSWEGFGGTAGLGLNIGATTATSTLDNAGTQALRWRAITISASPANGAAIDSSNFGAGFDNCRASAIEVTPASTTNQIVSGIPSIAGLNGRTMRIADRVIGHTCQFAHEDSTNEATASNRLHMPVASLTLVSPYEIEFSYSPTLSRWVPRTWTQNYASASPTSGTWALGSIIYNSAPASAGFIGWVCVAAGTPGTWKTWGAIS